MAQLYWDKTIPDRLVMHENNGEMGSSLGIDIFRSSSHKNIVSIFQDSDVPIVRDKFEDMAESVEFDLDDYLFLLKSQINMIEEWKKNETVRTDGKLQSSSRIS